jgi:hypothetical protein
VKLLVAGRAPDAERGLEGAENGREREFFIRRRRAPFQSCCRGERNSAQVETEGSLILPVTPPPLL